MRKYILITILTTLFAIGHWTDTAYSQNTHQLQSFHPTPNMSYSYLRLVPQPELLAACKDGSLYYRETLGLQICKGGVWQAFNFVWAQSTDEDPFDPGLGFPCQDVCGPFDGLCSTCRYLGDIYPSHNLLDLSANLKIGIGTKSPQFKLHIAGGIGDDGGSIEDGGIVFLASAPAATNLQDPLRAGEGVKFLWWPVKSSLRAGQVDADQWDESNMGMHSIAFGHNTTASGDYSSVTGGLNNAASGLYAKIGGGLDNSVTSEYGTIVGGERNVVNGLGGFIGGGFDNLISLDSIYSVIIGGESNKLYSSMSVIGGGYDNIIEEDAPSSVIGGGYSNRIFDPNPAIKFNESQGSVILAGRENQITGLYNSIGGGYSNEIIGRFSTIAGGYNNTSNGAFATFKGGWNNIGGGKDNEIVRRTSYGTIGGGLNNKIEPGAFSGLDGTYSTILGGHLNRIGNQLSFIGGGSNNRIIGHHSSIAGGGRSPNHPTCGGAFAPVNCQNPFFGANQYIANDYAVIGGGIYNLIWDNGDYSVIPGGAFNQARGEFNYVFGKSAISTGDRTFLFGYTDQAFFFPITTSADDAFIIADHRVGSDWIHTRVGVGVNSSPNGNVAPEPTERLHVGGDVLIAGGSIILGSANSFNGDVLGLNADSRVRRNDLAEIYNLSEEVEVGDLLVIDAANPNMLKKSTMPYDQSVVGIASSSPAILFEGSQLQINPDIGVFQKGTRAPVALAGRVPLKVSLENGPIEAGDYLTSSSKAGHAMKATDRDKAFGTIIGKALEKLEGESAKDKVGTIMVFVTMQ